MANWQEIWVLGFADRDPEGRGEGFWEGFGREERERIWKEYLEKIGEEKGSGRKRGVAGAKGQKRVFVPEGEE